ncbi:TlpA family protein disulfide reductase [Leptospira fletcheri]|uniref:TlpA family protein disulfide reductase n=1 Tax=Leptospira fletcheri TaxID=2484981 RepID=A0A4R9G5D7_9LEPT|nr:TlpA disulfide reductase family protein [Leptospira fletcheri]TGK06170.1 TlpA family protein disulfide reductase [Leptospira fletcheri]
MVFRRKLAIGFLLFSFLQIGSCSRPNEAPLYQIRLNDWEGNPHSFSEYRGQVLVLDFWASWCEPCKKAVPVVEALRKDLAGKNAQVFGINTENDLTVPEIKKAAKDFGMDYPSFLDPEWKLVQLLKIEGQPALFVFSASGKRLHSQYGISEKDLPVLQGRIRNWLEAP